MSKKKTRLQKNYSVQQNLFNIPFRKIKNLIHKKWQSLRKKLFYKTRFNKFQEFKPTRWRILPKRSWKKTGVRLNKGLKKLLIEKRKLKYYYDISEKKFKKILRNSFRLKKCRLNTKKTLINAILFRIDMILFKTNVVKTIDEGRNYIKKGLVFINDIPIKHIDHPVRKKIDIISFHPSLKKKILKNYFYQIFNRKKNFRHRFISNYTEINLNTGEIIIIKKPTNIKFPFKINFNLLCRAYRR